MGFWNGTKRVARFVGVSMPASMFGINQLRMGNEHVADLYRSLTNPVCPECNQGTLALQRTPGDDTGMADQEFPWICTRCKQVYIASADVREVRKLVAVERNTQAARRMTVLQLEERASIRRNHVMRSRWLFGCCFCLAAGFLYMLASGATILLSLNWLALALSMFVYAMKASYRAWQVTTATIFVRGSFRHWLSHERWFV